MKVEKLEKFQNKMGLKACKWSSLNAQGIETPLSYPYLELGKFPSHITISPLQFERKGNESKLRNLDPLIKTKMMQ